MIQIHASNEIKKHMTGTLSIHSEEIEISELRTCLNINVNQ